MTYKDSNVEGNFVEVGSMVLNSMPSPLITTSPLRVPNFPLKRYAGAVLNWKITGAPKEVEVDQHNSRFALGKLLAGFTPEVSFTLQQSRNLDFQALISGVSAVTRNDATKLFSLRGRTKQQAIWLLAIHPGLLSGTTRVTAVWKVLTGSFEVDYGRDANGGLNLKGSPQPIAGRLGDPFLITYETDRFVAA